MNRIIRLVFWADFLLIAFVLAFAPEAKALTISISNLPTSIDRDQETEVDLYFSCAGCGDFSYMRGVFYPGGTNYFGFTRNNSGSWIGTETDRSLYYVITKPDLVDASWSGKLKIKPNQSDPAYLGPGEYLFKVGRYTSANDSSADWSNELSLKITGPTPAPTPEPTSNPTIQPTPSPTGTKIPVPTPTKVPQKTQSPTPNSSPSPDPVIVPEVLGDKTSGPEPVKSEVQTKFPFVAVGLVFLGFVFIGASVYVAFRNRLR